MSWFHRIKDQALRHWRGEEGAVSVEFVILFPFIMSFTLLALDSGISQLRQTFLGRAVDLTIRDVRLGNVNESARMSELICEKTALIRDCLSNITVEMRPIDTLSFAGLNEPVRCVDREQAITPAVTFDPGAGTDAQELMLVRICVTADPIIRLTGWALGMPVNERGDKVLISTGVFVNEPR